MVITDEKKIDEVLTRGVKDLIVAEHLKARMMAGEQLRIKFGIDPTSPHMHLGHTVPLRKLRQFQELGHIAVLIIGDATAMVGDPTGRSEQRNLITREEIDQNKKTYQKQAFKVIKSDKDSLEVVRNGKWFDKMNGLDFMQMTSKVTLQQVMQRDDFRKRLNTEESTLSPLELLYPIMQGYDSVMVKADVEIGGADQLLNLHMGRRMQRRYEMPEQDILTVPLLVGTDGERKMSKSFGNNIPLETKPNEMFELVMTVADSAIVTYFELLTDLSSAEIAVFDQALKAGKNPRDIKLELAAAIVRIFHSKAAAVKAKKYFVNKFTESNVPDDIPEFKVASEMKLLEVLVASGLAQSNGEARRLVADGGVFLNDVKQSDAFAVMAPGTNGVLRRGKRQFVRLS